MNDAIRDLRRLSKMKKPKERKGKAARGSYKKKEEDVSALTLEEMEQQKTKLEDEAKDLKDKKMKAVADEDYDSAEGLKKQEKVVADKLTALKEALEKKAAEEKKPEEEAKPEEG